MVLSQMAPLLPKSFKKTYPFRLATTSFIYRGSYAANVALLGPYLDEIELLLFESDPPQNLPGEKEIDTLLELGAAHDLSYNIHLPTDISPGSLDPLARQRAVDTVKRVVELTNPLSPSTCTLHLPYEAPGAAPDQVKKWRRQLQWTMDELFDAGVPGGLISIETLFYPFDWIADILSTYPLAVCIDLGHLWLNNIDAESLYHQYARQVDILHVHGVKNSRDHLSLDRLSKTMRDVLMRILQDYGKVVSIEVFNYDDLAASLYFLEQSWNRLIPDNSQGSK